MNKRVPNFLLLNGLFDATDYDFHKAIYKLDEETEKYLNNIGNYYEGIEKKLIAELDYSKQIELLEPMKDLMKIRGFDSPLYNNLIHHVNCLQRLKRGEQGYNPLNSDFYTNMKRLKAILKRNEQEKCNDD